MHRRSGSGASAHFHQKHGGLTIAGLAHGLFGGRGGLLGTPLALGRGGSRIAATTSGRSDHRLSVGIDLHGDNIGVVGSLGSRVGRNAFSALDDGLLHANGTMSTMQLVVKAASVADVVAVLVSPPERRGSGLAICAAEGTNSTVLVIVLFVIHDGCGPLDAVASRREFVAGARFTLADLERMREVVVVSGASTAACGASSAVAEAIAWAGTGLWVVLSRTARASRRQLCFVSRWAGVRATWTAGSGAMGAVRFHVKSAGVANGAAIGSPPPKWGRSNAAIGAPHACVVSRWGRAGAVMIVRVTEHVLRAGGARGWCRRMRSCLLAVRNGTPTIGMVRRLDRSRGRRVYIAVRETTRLVLVARPRGGRDGTGVLIGISLRLGVVLGRVLVTVGRMIVAHSGRTASGRSWARVAEGVAHVQAC